MNIVLDFLLKGIIGGLASGFSKSIAKIISLLPSDQMVASIFIGLAETLSKRTKNTIDDDAVAIWKQQIKDSGINI